METQNTSSAVLFIYYSIWESFALFSTDNLVKISESISLLLRNLSLFSSSLFSKQGYRYFNATAECVLITAWKGKQVAFPVTLKLHNLYKSRERSRKPEISRACKWNWPHSQAKASMIQNQSWNARKEFWSDNTSVYLLVWKKY